ncbi:helix-turn-helix domain-containing protein [Alkalihalobacillus sp. NPDC078783]
MIDKRAEIIKNLIKKSKHKNQKAFAAYIDIPYTTLRSMLERDIGKASVDNVIKICRGLGITTEQLEEMASTKDKNNLPELNDKDERNIQIELQNMIDGLSEDSYAAFDGQDINEMDPEDRELLISSLENSLRLAKRLSKQKFTPKKYRDE